MAGSRRRGRHGGGGHSSSERWLITYADLITLLLVFFVIMYALSQVDKAKYEELKKSLSTSINYVPIEGSGKTEHVIGDGGENDTVVPMPFMQAEQLALTKLETQIDALAKEAGLDREITTRIEPRGLVVAISDRTFFAKGDAELRPEIVPLMDRVARVLKADPHYVRIEGHTDDTPIRTVRFPSNWELSAVRATTLVRFMVERHSFPPTRLSAAGYGEYYPRVRNTTEANRALNRRVDIVVLRSALTEQEPKGAKASTHQEAPTSHGQ
jgi:chemotaxis protein MotB